MGKKYDVYGIGNALVDVAFQVSEDFLEKHEIEKGVMTLVDEDTQHRLIRAINHEEAVKNPGGSAANTMKAISQLGGSGFYSCKVADDVFGKSYLDDMRASGIDTNFDGGDCPEGITGKCLVMITDDAERTMNSYLGISSTLSPKQIDESAIKNSQYVYIEGYLVTGESSFAAMRETKRIAKENNIKTAITLSDPAVVEGFQKRFQKVIGESVDLLFCNEKEAKIYAGTKNLDGAVALLKEFAHKFIVTRGSEGAIVFDGNKIIEIDPQPVEAVDTNGAGDMFAGAFLYGITNGMSEVEAGRLANLAGSKVVSQFGPRLEKQKMQQILRKAQN